jgi:hypothetical protein
VSAPKLLPGLYGTDVSAQLKAMGITESSGQEVPELSPKERRAAEVFLGRVDRLHAHPEFDDARRIASSLTNIFRDLGLDQVLTMLVYLAVLPQGISAQDRLRLWTLGTGKSWKALKEFPERLRNMAKEIENTNNSYFFGPRNWLNPTTVRGRVALDQFSLLPGGLRVYAAFIESVTSRLPIAASNDPLLVKVGRHSRWVLGLSDIVKAVTGRFHDAQASALLNAAYCVLNPNAAGAKFTPQTLVDLRSRRSRRLRQT